VKLIAVWSPWFPLVFDILISYFGNAKKPASQNSHAEELCSPTAPMGQLECVCAPSLPISTSTNAHPPPPSLPAYLRRYIIFHFLFGVCRFTENSRIKGPRSITERTKCRAHPSSALLSAPLPISTLHPSRMCHRKNNRA